MGQELGGHFRQQRAGEDVVDVAGARVDLGAAGGDRVDQLGRVAERRPVVVRDPPADFAQLEPDDLLHHLVAQRIVGNDRQAAEERRLERLQQFGKDALARTASGSGARIRIAAEAFDQVGAGVGRHDDDRVLEIDVAAFAVLHVPFVEHLVEDVLHAGVGLFHFVQQDDAVGLAANRLGQHAPFAVADVARRRAHQQRDFVLFLELRHVDHGHVLLATVEQFGQRDRGLGLADAAGAGQQEDADRRSRIGELGPRGANRLGDPLQRMRLADDRLFHRSFRLSTVWISSATMRPTGMPVQADTVSATAWALTQGCTSGVSPCNSVQFLLDLAQARSRIFSRSSLESGSAAAASAVAADFAGRGRRVLPVARLICRRCRRCVPLPPSRPVTVPAPVPRCSSSNLRDKFLFLLAIAPRELRAVLPWLPVRPRAVGNRFGVIGPGSVSRSRMPIETLELFDAGVGSLRRPAAWPSWLRPMRAQVVSSRLTALSGSCRPEM